MVERVRRRLSSLIVRAGALFELVDEKGGDLRDVMIRAFASARVQLGQLRAKRREGQRPVPVQATSVPKVATPPEASVGLPRLGDHTLAAQVFGKSTCPWSQRARDLLESRGVKAAYIDLAADEMALTKARLEAETKQFTVPYVYLRGQFVGGYNALAEIERLGHLAWRVMTPDEQAAAPAHYRPVAVAPRASSNETAPGEQAEPVVLPS